MCGIFGQVSTNVIDKTSIKKVIKHSEQRGIDSSGLIYYKDGVAHIAKADYNIEKLLEKENLFNSEIILGHSRLITNGLHDNQPVYRDGVSLLHNGIVVNHNDLWKDVSVERNFQIDSEIIVGIALDGLQKGMKLEEIPELIMAKCKGVLACAMVFHELGKLVLFSNNGSLFKGMLNGSLFFASEKYAINEIGCQDITQIKLDFEIIDIPVPKEVRVVRNDKLRDENLIPEFQYNREESGLLFYENAEIKRCTKCVLPETMPFISFDEKGVCNYCNNYQIRNKPKPVDELFNLVEPYRRDGNTDCIVPFSGGRDSCYGLHLIVKELKMTPVTYTYDWGMVTDLGRRNISRMCGELGIENIIVAADISKKRKNIRMNLQAWLKSPHLGMMAMLTAGDKHFFRYVEHIKRQTGVNLNLWGVNPLEVTHFKAGFLGIPPDFEEKRVYSHGISKQLRYHRKRFGAMLESLGYFNSSLWDTLSGEYYRSFTEKKDYYHIFDYWTWEEDIVEDVLINQYDWEVAVDTPTTWRIGDGTAGFYNYVYQTVAGFTEHDTFRSNQIREGQITREKALELIKEENKPRYQNIKWYLDTLNLNFRDVIKIVNGIPKIYEK